MTVDQKSDNLNLILAIASPSELHADLFPRLVYHRLGDGPVPILRGKVLDGFFRPRPGEDWDSLKPLLRRLGPDMLSPLGLPDDGGEGAATGLLGRLDRLPWLTRQEGLLPLAGQAGTGETERLRRSNRSCADLHIQRLDQLRLQGVGEKGDSMGALRAVENDGKRSLIG